MVVTVLVNMAGLLLIYWRRLTKKRLARRLEEGQTRNNTDARQTANGAISKETESLGTLVGEEASQGKLVNLKSDERIADKNETIGVSPMVRMRSLSAQQSAETRLQTPQRSLSLGSRKRWREDTGGEIDLPALLHSNGSVNPVCAAFSGSEKTTAESTPGKDSLEEARSETLASNAGSSALQPSAERANGHTDIDKNQIEVLVSPPDFENREDGPVVAPSWRGRLKRLRKKRPLWLFKACVYIVVLGMLAALLAGLDLPWVTVGAAVILICLDFRDAEETLDQVSTVFSLQSFLIFCTS